MNIEELLKKKILIWGYGLESKSVLKLLLKNKIKNKILVANLNKVEEKIDNVEFILEKDILKYSYDVDVVIKSSGVSSYKKEIEILKNNGIIITTILNIFLSEVEKHKNIKTIGITGTKGKSTTASICNYILNNFKYKSILLGNIGVSFLDVIEDLDNYDYLVLELSSYQIKDLKYELDYSILLNLFPEHIDWHLTHENYFKDKLNILNYSKKSIINFEDKVINNYLIDKKNDKYFYFNTNEGFFVKDNFILNFNKQIYSIDLIQNIKGEHIWKNICAVLTFLLEENFNIIDALNILKNFKTLNHRLEIFYENKENNTMFIDDSISTIPEATIEAIKTFDKHKIFLILGGFDRKQDYTNLITFINNYITVKKIFLLGQTGKRLNEIFNIKENNINNINIKYFDTLESIVKSIKENDLNNTVILLSPAAPSYDAFKNFEERGEKFKTLMLDGIK